MAGVIYLFYPEDSVPVADLVWQQEVTEVGVGSPRLFDMNRDGVQDIIIGSGFEWSEDGMSSMMLINGQSGRLMWKTVVPESAYGTPVLIDANGDQLPDVPTVGRFVDVWMLHGRSGEVLWKLTEQNPSMSFLPCNFNSPVPIPDQDNDGIVDFITVQGGLANKTSHIQIIDTDTNKVIMNSLDRNHVLDSFNNLLTQSEQVTFNIKVCRGTKCEKRAINRKIYLLITLTTY